MPSNGKRSNRSRMSKTRKNRSYRAAPPKPSKTLVKQVQNIIHKQIEDKKVVFSNSVTAFNQRINSTGDALRLMPQIPQALTEKGRVGNQLKMRSLYLRGVLTFTQGQTSAANTRIGVRLIIYRAKRFNDWNQTATDLASSYSNLVEDSVTGLDGSLAAFNAPLNRDYFSVVMDKRFYMSQSLQALSTGTVDNRQTTKFLNFKIPYSKRTVKYDAVNSATEAINYPYVMSLTYVKLDGSLADTDATTYLTLQYTTTAKYEDA